MMLIRSFANLGWISPRPVLFITGEHAYKLASEPKGLLVVPSAGQVDLHDRVRRIPFDKLAAFFDEHLK